MFVCIYKSTSSENSSSIQMLHDSVRIGNLELIKDLIINKKVDVNTKEENGSTPLFIAAELGNTEILKTLLEAGAEVNAMNNFGHMPLHVASDPKTVKILLNFGADVDL